MRKILVAIIFLILIVGCNNNEKILEPNKVNLNELAIEDKKVNDLIFSNTSIIYDQGITTFKTKMTNIGDEIKINNINIDFYSKNSTKILTLQKNVKELIKKNNEYQIVIATDIDLTDIYEIKYNID